MRCAQSCLNERRPRASCGSICGRPVLWHCISAAPYGYNARGHSRTEKVSCAWYRPGQFPDQPLFKHQCGRTGSTSPRYPRLTRCRQHSCMAVAIRGLTLLQRGRWSLPNTQPYHVNILNGRGTTPAQQGELWFSVDTTRHTPHLPKFPRCSPMLRRSPGSAPPRSIATLVLVGSLGHHSASRGTLPQPGAI